MQRVTVLCVGKLKEKFYAEAAAEYAKRLSRFCKLEILELPEERLLAEGQRQLLTDFKCQIGIHVPSVLSPAGDLHTVPRVPGRRAKRSRRPRRTRPLRTRPVVRLEKEGKTAKKPGIFGLDKELGGDYTGKKRGSPCMAG